MAIIKMKTNTSDESGTMTAALLSLSSINPHLEGAPISINTAKYLSALAGNKGWKLGIVQRNSSKRLRIRRSAERSYFHATFGADGAFTVLVPPAPCKVLEGYLDRKRFCVVQSFAIENLNGSALTSRLGKS